MNRRTLLASGAAALVAPRFARAAALRAYGGRLVAALLDKPPALLDRGNPRTADPHAARTRFERDLAACLHLPLFWPVGGEGHGPGPLLDGVSTRDGKTWTLSLKTGLVFSDGSPIRAADVIASLDRAMASPAGRALAAAVEFTARRDDATVEITTRGVVRDPAEVLSDVSTSIVSSAAGQTFWGPHGAGPFAPAPDAAPGEIALVPNPRSPVGRAFLDRLVFRPVPDGAGAIGAALRQGTIQVAPAAGAPAGERLAADEPRATIALVLSARLAPDLRARIAAAPNRKYLADVLLPGRAVAASTLLPPAMLAPLADAPPARAPGPKPAPATALSLAIADASPEIRAVADRLEIDLLDAGVSVTRRWASPADLEQIAAKDRWDLLLTEWIPCDADPGRALAAAARDPVLAPGIPAGALDPIAGAADPDARVAAARAAEQKIRDAALLLPIAHPRTALRRAAEVAGLGFSGGCVDWADVRLERAG